MAAVLVQQKEVGSTAINVSPITLTFTSALTAGNSVVVTVIRANPSESKTFGATDTADSGAFTVAVNSQRAGLDDQTVILYRHSIPGGNTTISVTISPTSASGNVRISGYEVSGLANSVPTTGSNPDEGATTSHLDSTTQISGTGFVATGNCVTGSRIHTAGSGYTLDSPGAGVSEFRVSQHLIGTITNNQGDHTHDGATTNGTGAMALFAEVPSRRWLLTR